MECNAWNTDRRQVTGTTGRETPVQVSQRRVKLEPSSGIAFRTRVVAVEPYLGVSESQSLYSVQIPSLRSQWFPFGAVRDTHLDERERQQQHCHKLLHIRGQ